MIILLKLMGDGMDVVHYRTLMPLARRHASNKVSISAHLVVTRTTKPHQPATPPRGTSGVCFRDEASTPPPEVPCVDATPRGDARDLQHRCCHDPHLTYQVQLHVMMDWANGTASSSLCNLQFPKFCEPHSTFP